MADEHSDARLKAAAKHFILDNCHKFSTHPNVKKDLIAINNPEILVELLLEGLVLHDVKQ